MQRASQHMRTYSSTSEQLLPLFSFWVMAENADNAEMHYAPLIHVMSGSLLPRNVHVVSLGDVSST